MGGQCYRTTWSRSNETPIVILGLCFEISAKGAIVFSHLISTKFPVYATAIVILFDSFPVIRFLSHKLLWWGTLTAFRQYFQHASSLSRAVPNIQGFLHSKHEPGSLNSTYSTMAPGLLSATQEHLSEVILQPTLPLNEKLLEDVQAQISGE